MGWNRRRRSRGWRKGAGAAGEIGHDDQAERANEAAIGHGDEQGLVWVGEDLPQDDAVDGGQGRPKLLTGRVEGELSQELSEARQIGSVM